MNYKTACIVMLSLLPLAATAQLFQESIPNGHPFPNPAGASSTYSTAGNGSARTLLDVVRFTNYASASSSPRRKKTTS